jgi:hypothetical protein
MRCHEVEAQLMRFVDDRLPAATARKVDAHLDVCRRCRQVYAEEVELCATFHAEGLDPVGDELVQGVMARVETVEAARTLRHAPVVPIRPAAGAALAVAAAAAVLVLWQAGGPTWSHWSHAAWTGELGARSSTLTRAGWDALRSVGTLLETATQTAGQLMSGAWGEVGTASGGETMILAAATTAAALVMCVGLVSKVRSTWAEERRP